MRFLLYCLLCLSACPSTLAVASDSSPAVVVLDQQADEGIVIRRDNLQMLVTEEALSWEQVQSPAFGDWTSPRANIVGERVETGALWLRMMFYNPELREREWVLKIRASRVEKLTSYLPMENGVRISSHENTREQNSSLSFTTAPGETQVLYLQVSGAGYLYMPLSVWTPEAYESHDRSRLLIFGIAFGVFLIMTLYNASLYLFTRDSMYLAYSNTVASILLFVLAVTGYGAAYVWGSEGWLAEHAYAVFTSYCFLSVAYFLRVFLNLPSLGGWILHLNNVFLLVWALTLLASVVGYQGAALRVVGPAGLLATAAGVLTTGYLWFRKHENAKFFFISWAAVSITTVITIGVLLGWIPYFNAVEYLQTYSFVLEAALLAMALAARISREREARETAQKIAFERQQEVLAIQARSNEELEAKVSQRTRDLESALLNLEEANKRLSRLSEVDSLTSVYNRRYFDKLAERELARAIRHQRQLSIVLIDIDHFKNINDTYGHIAGDRCLKLVAQCICQQVKRSADVVARYGGEEFAVILPDTTKQHAAMVADRIRVAIEELVLLYEGKTIRLTASFGVVGDAVTPEDNVSSWVDLADKALYAAKAKGRNRVESAKQAQRSVHCSQ